MIEKNDRVDDPWKLTCEDWNPDHQPLREALCTLGNGYFATRGAAEEVHARGVHYPGTYLAGGYNRLKTEISGRLVENEDLVNWPDWTCLTFRAQGGEWLDIDAVDVLEFRQSVDLAYGILERRILVRHDGDRETSLVSRRIVHMEFQHLAAIQWTLTPYNWSGRMEVRSTLNGDVSNKGVARYRDLNSQHLEIVDSGGLEEDSIYLQVRTSQSHVNMVQAARTRAFHDSRDAVLDRDTSVEGPAPYQSLHVECREDEAVRVEKVVAVYTSRDVAISNPLIAASKAVDRSGSFDRLLKSHKIAWSHLWDRADIEIGGSDNWSQLVLRLHIFHLLQTVSLKTIDLDTGVPARGWHGEAYRGHIFWDELFIFPFLNLRIPELTRSLLMYRYRRLFEARHLAHACGCRGAMFPWQSGSSGREESQVLHLNPESGRWIPDNTHRQRHINAAIAYNIWQYFQTTRDREFLSFYGTEMLLEIARFWSSIAEYNPERGRYEIHRVVGPDEFHTQYPGTGSEGLNNNAYTNVMAAWVIRCACHAFEMLAEDQQRDLAEKLEIADQEFRHWEDVSRKLFVPFHGDGIISQFEGYEELEEFDWDGYRDKYGDIQRLDRILEAEGDSPNRYKASKQADVLMLFYLFSHEELHGIFEHLGYEFDSTTIPKNIEYYMARTSHGSTLSRVVHSWVLASTDRRRATELFQQALASDVADIQGGTTAEGIHLGAMAGTVDVIQRCHTGLEIRDDVLWFNPCLPRDFDELRLRLRYRGHWLRVTVTRQQLQICFEHGWSDSVRIGFDGRVYSFSEGDCREFAVSGAV